MSNILCLDATGSVAGSMDARNRTASAWVYIPVVSPAPATFAGSSCSLRAFSTDFSAVAFSGPVTRTPLVAGSWFQLSGVFPATATTVYGISVECVLPVEWACCADPVHVWYIDDVRIE
jgi:hypothetical protein